MFIIFWLKGKIDRIMTPQRCPCPTSWSLLICVKKRFNPVNFKSQLTLLNDVWIEQHPIQQLEGRAEGLYKTEVFIGTKGGARDLLTKEKEGLFLKYQNIFFLNHIYCLFFLREMERAQIIDTSLMLTRKS